MQIFSIKCCGCCCNAFMNAWIQSTHMHIWAAGRRDERSWIAAFPPETEHHTCGEEPVKSRLHLWKHLGQFDNFISVNSHDSKNFIQIPSLLVTIFKMCPLNTSSFCFLGYFSYQFQSTSSSSPPVLFSRLDWNTQLPLRSFNSKTRFISKQVFNMEKAHFKWKCTDHPCQFQKLNNSLIVHWSWNRKPTSRETPRHFHSSVFCWLFFWVMICTKQLWYLTEGKCPSVGRSPVDRSFSLNAAH